MNIERTAYVYLGFYGDFDPEVIAELVPLVPDKKQKKHSKNPKGRIPRTSILRYAEVSTSMKVLDVYDLGDEALRILLPHKEVFKRIIREHSADVVFQVVLDFNSDEDVATPAIGFTQELLNFLNHLEASIDIDTYRA